jgi:hypothetical protein
VPFLRPLSDTAPDRDIRLPWPIYGLAYVIAFMGPLCAGPIIGTLSRDWRAAGVGLLIGICVTFLNAWLSDRFIDPFIASLQPLLQNSLPRVLANIAAFAWAIILCGVSMLAPLAILGSEFYNGIR